jgi:hypothetical protein
MGDIKKQAIAMSIPNPKAIAGRRHEIKYEIKYDIKFFYRVRYAALTHPTLIYFFDKLKSQKRVAALNATTLF